jgi:hypothetical protein
VAGPAEQLAQNAIDRLHSPPYEVDLDAESYSKHQPASTHSHQGAEVSALAISVRLLPFGL